MKRLLLFTLTLCFCINIQAKESTVVYKLNGYKTLLITGNFEKGLLTEGPVQFDYKIVPHTVKLEGKYSPQNQTFQGRINGTYDCYGTIYTTNGKPISKKTAASEWMIKLHLGGTINGAKTEFDDFFIGMTPQQVGNNKSHVWRQLSSFMQQFEEVKTHNATIYFSNGNKYIGPVHYDGFHWKIGKYGCQEYLSIGSYNISKESFNIKYLWNNGDSFEGAALRFRNREDGIIPISGKMTYNNGVKDQTWELSSNHYKYFTFNKNPSQLKEELITIEVKQRAKEKAWQQEQEERWQRIKARADSLKLADEKQKHQTEEQKKQAFIRKYGQRYGSLIYQGKLELGMTQQMCQEVIDIKSYDIGKSIRSGHRVETWTFNKDKQDMQVAAAMTQLSGEEAMALTLLMGFADSVGASTPKYSILVFTDGKLTSLY